MNALGSVQSLTFELNPWHSTFLEFLKNEIHLLNETSKSVYILFQGSQNSEINQLIS